MSYAALNAARTAQAARAALATLGQQAGDPNEAHQRKTVMIERIAALASAAADSGQPITLTSEEFWLLSHNW